MIRYHVVFIPKYRRKVLFGQIRQEQVEAFRRLARQKESAIEEGHMQPDHIHILISIPLQVLGYASSPLCQDSCPVS